jgi:hypothetical protein
MVEAEELRDMIDEEQFDEEGESAWYPVPHRAPCGAHCMGGGVDYGERDVHVPSEGACGRCGASDTEIARIIERKDGAERVVIRKYTSEVHRDLGFRIEREVKRDGEWTGQGWWNTNHPESLELTIEWAQRYVPWLAGPA